MPIDDNIADYRPKYKKPNSIRIYELPVFCGGNIALKEHLKDKEHVRQKYYSKYQKSKESKRMY